MIEVGQIDRPVLVSNQLRVVYVAAWGTCGAQPRTGPSNEGREAKAEDSRGLSVFEDPSRQGTPLHGWRSSRVVFG